MDKKVKEKNNTLLVDNNIRISYTKDLKDEIIIFAPLKCKRIIEKTDKKQRENLKLLWSILLLLSK